MIYKAIGLMSGSSLNGLDIAYVQFHETAGKWSYELISSACYAYPADWLAKLRVATGLSALDYQLLHTEYGRYTGELVNSFIEMNGLHHKVHLIASHGHTTFHQPAQQMTAQLGDGAAIAAVTGLPVVSDLRAMDIAFGGQGAPIVPVGERLLFPQYDLLLNLGGIANISFRHPQGYRAFDICPANSVLNMLANSTGLEYDKDGSLAAEGQISEPLMNILNAQPYYHQSFPRSLSNSFGREIVFPLISQPEIALKDKLRTYVEHIVQQVKNAIIAITATNPGEQSFTSDVPGSSGINATDSGVQTLFITGGGAFNGFLISRLQEVLEPLQRQVIVPRNDIVSYKESIIMALIGVLRWREEYNSTPEATGSRRNSIGGALWLGGEA